MVDQSCRSGPAKGPVLVSRQPKHKKQQITDKITKTFKFNAIFNLEHYCFCAGDAGSSIAHISFSTQNICGIGVEPLIGLEQIRFRRKRMLGQGNLAQQ